MRKQKILFFLGNGFSQGFDFPSMIDFWDLCLEPRNQFYKELLREAKERYPLKYFIDDIKIKDIELLLTIWRDYSEAYEEITNAAQSGRGHYQAYVANLCDLLQTYTLDAINNSTLFSAFQGWLKTIESKYEIIFITTNYDLLLEKIIENCSWRYHLIGNKENSVSLRKLHGSISWFVSSSSSITKARADIKYEFFFESSNKKFLAYDIAYDCLRVKSMQGLQIQFKPQVDKYSMPTLIPPTIGKKYTGLFNHIIASISHDFQGLDQIIIGYSFPDSDPIVRDIVMAECKKNRYGNREVTYINKNPDICDKVKKIFEGNVNIISQKWDLEILKTLLN